jgi:molybdopterin molybdotransferase
LEDDFDRCYEALVQALDEVDYVITTGGAAVGDFDFVQRLLHEVDAEVLFNKVAMRPGSVTTVARLGKKWIFGLSGNPAACYIGFEFFARPVLKAALGAEQWHLPRTKAVVDQDIPSRNPFTRFLRAHLRLDWATFKVRPVGLDKSGVVSALIDANALIVVPAGSEGYQAGEEAEVILLDEPVDTFVSGSELSTSNYTI